MLLTNILYMEGLSVRALLLCSFSLAMRSSLSPMIAPNTFFGIQDWQKTRTTLATLTDRKGPLLQFSTVGLGQEIVLGPQPNSISKANHLSRLAF